MSLCTIYVVVVVVRVFPKKKKYMPIHQEGVREVKCHENRKQNKKKRKKINILKILLMEVGKCLTLKNAKYIHIYD